MKNSKESKNIEILKELTYTEINRIIVNLQTENKALKQQLTLGGVVKSFYCLGDPKFGGVKRCSKQCKGCELSKEQ